MASGAFVCAYLLPADCFASLSSAFDLLAQQVEVEADENEISTLTRRRAALLADKLDRGDDFKLIDVREPNEVAVDAYPGAVVVPLSSFDPQDIPDPGGKQVVFACRSGKRSVTASLAAQSAGLAYNKHLAGGILAWKAAGLPTKAGG